MKSLEDILEAYKHGEVELDSAARDIAATFFQGLDHSTIDHDRPRRTGAAEVIYAEYKTPIQVADVFEALAEKGSDVLATRASDEIAKAVEERVPGAHYHSLARIIALKQRPKDVPPFPVAVVSAGTSDASVFEEAALTAEFFGNEVLRINDVGVAGIHRLLNRIDEIRTARVVVVIAGMEGALPSVIGGLVEKPVIAVPTSIGYGASFGGVAALLGMLNSCASGVSVVNIDNGFGAGFIANKINRL